MRNLLRFAVAAKTLWQLVRHDAVLPCIVVSTLQLRIATLLLTLFVLLLPPPVLLRRGPDTSWH
jgi:hypothetical protein